MSFGLDGSFAEDTMLERSNAHLANALGNLLSRTLNMTVRYCDGRVPKITQEGDAERALREACEKTAIAVDHFVRRCELQKALEAVFQLVDACNRYVDAREPWRAAREMERDEKCAQEVRTTLATVSRALHAIGLLLAPFLPRAAENILRGVGAPDALKHARLPESAANWNALPEGARVAAGAALFPRLKAVRDA